MIGPPIRIPKKRQPPKRLNLFFLNSSPALLNPSPRGRCGATAPPARATRDVHMVRVAGNAARRPAGRGALVKIESLGQMKIKENCIWLWRPRSQLYRQRFLQPNTHFATSNFFEIYKIHKNLCTAPDSKLSKLLTTFFFTILNY